VAALGSGTMAAHAIRCGKDHFVLPNVRGVLFLAHF
jgi:hypothetical protein